MPTLLPSLCRKYISQYVTNTVTPQHLYKDDLTSVEQYSAQMFIVLSLPQKPNDTNFF